MKEENTEIIKTSYGEYEVLTGEAEQKRLEEVRLMSWLEEQSALACAEQEGIEIGRKKAIEDMRKRGKEAGEKIGKAKEKKKIAKELLKLKIPIEQIMQVTELTEEEIRTTQKDEK